MKTYRIKETVAYWVTYTRDVDADNKTQAMQIFWEGDGRPYDEPEIGDAIDGYDANIDIKEIKG